MTEDNLNRDVSDKAKRYSLNVLLVASQVASTLLGGDPDESVSSRIGKAQVAKKKWAVNFAAPFVNCLMQEENHCLKAIEPDEGSKQIWDWSK